MRVLVMGYFSTFGDLEVLTQVSAWLSEVGATYDIAPYDPVIRLALSNCVDPTKVDPSSYTHVCIVCGPFYPEFFIERRIDLDAFAHCVRIGVNLSILSPNGGEALDCVIGRDGMTFDRPDLTFRRPLSSGALIGLCLARPQDEYGNKSQLRLANERLRALAERAGSATVHIDTEFPVSRNAFGLRSLQQFDSLVSRLDAILTTRLHGLVLPLQLGVPVVALDSVRGGGKVAHQAKVIGWPHAFQVECASDADLEAALAFCLTSDGKAAARRSSAYATHLLDNTRKEFQQALGLPAGGAHMTFSRQRRRRIRFRWNLRRAQRRWPTRGEFLLLRSAGLPIPLSIIVRGGPYPQLHFAAEHSQEVLAGHSACRTLAR